MTSRRSALRRELDDMDRRDREARTERAAGSRGEALRLRQAIESERRQAEARAEAERMVAAMRRLSRAGHRAPLVPEIVSRADVEHRVRRACLTHAVSPRVRGPECRVAWPATLVEWADLVARGENPDNVSSEALRPRFEPTPADVRDELVALGWMLHLTIARSRRAPPGDWDIVMLHALGWGWREIGRRIGGSSRDARRRYDGAIDQCHRAANLEAAAEAAGQAARRRR